MNSLIVAAIRCSLLFVLPALTYAGSAQWNLNPRSVDWNTAANWTPMTVPNGPGDIATFALSNVTEVSISANTEANTITFTPGNSVHTITVNPSLTLTVSGAGIIGEGAQFVTATDFFNSGTIVFSDSAVGNSSFSIGNSSPGGTIIFKDSSTANSAFIDSTRAGGSEFLGSSTAAYATIFMSQGGAIFADSSSAGNANIIEFVGADLHFLDNSTAANASIIQTDGIAGLEFRGNSSAGNVDIGTGADTTIVNFADTSSADNAIIRGDAEVFFDDSSSAGSAAIGIFNQSLIFAGSSIGGTAQVEIGSDPIFGGIGILEIAGHNPPGVTIESIEGDETSLVSLGANLTVSSNNFSTTFSGVIEDNGFNRSLTKIGTGMLDLKGGNTYTGQTYINGGVLQVDGSTSSNTFINHKGALAGGGTVYGNVTNYGGEISPGDPLGVPGVLTVNNNYTQTPSASFVIQVADTDPGQVSVLNVLGNATLNGELDPELVNGFVPATGQSFTILGYASLTGSFSHIRNQVFDNGRKRWSLVYQPTTAALVVVRTVTKALTERARNGFSVV